MLASSNEYEQLIAEIDVLLVYLCRRNSSRWKHRSVLTLYSIKFNILISELFKKKQQIFDQFVFKNFSYIFKQALH